VKGLTIGQFVERTGVAEGTLRMWERRHGFPTPQRLPSGHRRYSEGDVELVARMALERSAGLSLAAAIARVQTRADASTSSVYAALRRQRPDLEPSILRKPALLALTHAIEDESLSRAEAPLLFASFQTERFYRQTQARWRELSRGATLTLAFADFDQLRTPRDSPAEIPVGRSQPLAREWTVVCCAADHAACLTAWEPPALNRSPHRERVFESIWSVEPEVAWEAARICAGIAAAQSAALVEPVRQRLALAPGAPTPRQLRLAAAITSRTLSYLSV
jgi:MerR family transcriptional regulator, light-induced transcriptional regulator